MWLFTNPFDPFHIKMFNFKAKNQILIMTFRNKLLQQWKLSLGQFQGWDPHFWESGWQSCGNNPGNVKFVTKAPYIDWIKLGKPIKDKTFLNWSPTSPSQGSSHEPLWFSFSICILCSVLFCCNWIIIAVLQCYLTLCLS